MVYETEFYDTLELDPSCSTDDVKKAYKKMASKWHPDKHINNKINATKKFQDINTAYDTLSDDRKRQIYDQVGQNEDNVSMHANMQNPFAGMPGGDGFESMMNMMHGVNSMNGMSAIKKNSESDKQINYKIPIKYIYEGFSKKINIDSKRKCPQCTIKITTCNICKGTGVCAKQFNMGGAIMHKTTVCSECGQMGTTKSKTNCIHCKSTGFVDHSEEHTITFNKNDDYKETIVLKEKGNYDIYTKKNRNINITFEIKDPDYDIKEYDIIYTFKINIRSALSTDNLYFTHPNGKLYSFNRSDIIKSDDIKIIPKLGLPGSYSNGNLIIKFEYIYPSELLNKSQFNEFIKIHNKQKHNSNTICESLDLIDIEKYQKDNMPDQDDEHSDMHNAHVPQCQQM